MGSCGRSRAGDHGRRGRHAPATSRSNNQWVGNTLVVMVPSSEGCSCGPAAERLTPGQHAQIRRARGAGADLRRQLQQIS
jgi:hypothetical protein